MRLILKSFMATAAIAISTTAVAQTTTTNTPVRPTAPVQPNTPGTTQANLGDASQTAPGQMGTTPGQMQTTPGAASQTTPAVTGTTPSGQTTGTATTTGTTTQSAQLEAPEESDFKNGATIYDQSGAVVGRIQSYSSSGVVVSTGKARAQIPMSSFGKGSKGLVIGMSKSEFEAQAGAAKKK